MNVDLLETEIFGFEYRKDFFMRVFIKKLIWLSQRLFVIDVT